MLFHGAVVEAISIHALREEGDAVQFAAENGSEWISIHALREEGDDTASAMSQQRRRFLSTPSARRATTRRTLRQAED